MKKVVLLLAMAVISTGLLTAQNSRVVSTNGKENPFEKKFSDRTTMTAKPDIIQVTPEFVKQDDKFVSLKESKPIKSPVISDVKPQTGTYKAEFCSVRKSSRDDVATVTLDIVGDPLAEYGWVSGFHMILDKDADMLDYFLDNYLTSWHVLYEKCEYFIPENASPDINNPNWLVDDKQSINIPAGIYDAVIWIVNPADNRYYTAYLEVNGTFDGRDTEFDDFEFKAGFEYIFRCEWSSLIVYNAEDDVVITEIILPPSSTELSAQEEVSVVLFNNGFNDITGQVGFSYNVNGGEYTAVENATVSLKPGEELKYTFTAKADLTTPGYNFVWAKVDYALDLFSPNNKMLGFTRKIVPLELPFVENFDVIYNVLWMSPLVYTYLENWTILNENSEWNEYDTWTDNTRMDADTGPNYVEHEDGIGCVQVTAPYYEPPYYDEPANDYLITAAPMLMPEAGTYSIAFYVLPWRDDEKLRVLYGTSSDYREMTVLEDFKIASDWEWSIYFKNFTIQTPGAYYFAFHYYSYDNNDDGNQIALDKIRIAAGEYIGEPDITITKCITPISSCDMAGSATIGAEVCNKGAKTITEFTLTYKSQNGTTVSQTFHETLKLRETITVYFDQKFDFSGIEDYHITFSASTPDESNLKNNEMEILVRHYSAVTEYPYINNFESEGDVTDWTSVDANGWNFNFWGVILANNVSGPLRSRCFTLQPNTYRFRINVLAGSDYETVDFYVAYGKSGTDPHSWTPVKEFLNYSTFNGTFAHVDEYMLLEVAEAGEYEIAIVGTRTTSYLEFYGSTLELAPEHDFIVRKIESPEFFARVTPKYQVYGDNKFKVAVENISKTATDNGNLKMFIETEEVISKDFAFTATGQKLNVDLKYYKNKLSDGAFLYSLKASNNYGLNINAEKLILVSDSTYIWDNIDTYFETGLGFDYPAGLGSVYELKNSDVLTSINIGFLDHPDVMDNLYFVIAVYRVSENDELGEMLFEVKYPRISNNTEGINYDLPDTELKPGRYFFEVRQLDENTIAVVCDYEYTGVIWVYEPQNDYFGPESFGWGYLHVRPNFGKYGVGIEEFRVDNGELIIYPNPATSELRILVGDKRQSRAENGELRIEKINIYNAVGQVVMNVSNINATSYKLNVESLNSGLYFISVQTKDGVVNRKFVVK